MGLWATVGTLLICGPVGIFSLIYCLVTGYPLTSMWVLGCGLAASGVGLFAWFGVLAASKGLVHLTHLFGRWLKSLFVKVRTKDDVSAAPVRPYPQTPYVTQEGAPSYDNRA